MKKILSLAVMFGALCASVGCDDKPKSNSSKAATPDASKKETTPPAKTP